MLIDWFTVGAQALNFIILVWLLKRFLYKPILNAVDAREKRIAAELADADAKKAEAAKGARRVPAQERGVRPAARRAPEQGDGRGESRTSAASRRCAEGGRCLERQATGDAAKRRHNLNQAISRRTQQEVFAIARKALTDLATTSLEERMGEVFTRRLRTMDGKAKEGLAEALKTASEPALVRSAFDLPAEQRATIQNALNETFSAEVHVRFETAPDLVSGIELTTNGQKVAWSIADYLASLEKGVGELLKRRTNQKRGQKPKLNFSLKPKLNPNLQPKLRPRLKS